MRGGKETQEKRYTKPTGGVWCERAEEVRVARGL